VEVECSADVASFAADVEHAKNTFADDVADVDVDAAVVAEESNTIEDEQCSNHDTPANAAQ